MNRRVVIPSAKVAAMAVAVGAMAGCGSGGEASPDPTPRGGTTQPTTPTPPGRTPGPQVREFLTAYSNGDVEAACATVTPAFRNPRDRGATGSAACTRASQGADPLRSGLVVKDTRVGRLRASVLTLNSRRTQFAFSLVNQGGWRIENVRLLTPAKGSKPRAPAP